jgi:hypothetical protein
MDYEDIRNECDDGLNNVKVCTKGIPGRMIGVLNR